MLLNRVRTGRLYYGWVMLWAVSLTEVVSWGILYYAYSVFVAPMARDLAVELTNVTFNPIPASSY